MTKYFILFWFVVSIINLSNALCPQLKPNQGVQVLCSTAQKDSIKTGKKFKCYSSNLTNTTTEFQASVGTIVVYKCNKYFKPINSRQKSGTLNCTEDGIWTNHRTFQEFYCEYDCGKKPALKNELITQGNSTKAKYWPWVATIFRKFTKDGQFKYSFGGTLIGQKTILTAAHCVTNEGVRKLPTNIFKVILGRFSSNYQENLEQEDVQIISESTIFNKLPFNCNINRFKLFKGERDKLTSGLSRV